MKRGRAFALVVVGVVAGCCAASADGKFFSPADDVREPNQKALLWLENGRETLILQVKYEGAAGDFGWVVPVPGRPKIDTAPSKLFHELARVTRPIVVSRGQGQWRGARTGGIGDAGVEVVERVQVGPYDATVLAATEEGALAEWLRGHGYRMPTRAEEVLGSYVARGWHYVAVRIDTARLERELLADLRRADPQIESLEKAPEQLAELLVRLAERDAAEGREVARRVGEVLDRRLGTVDKADLFASSYDRVVDAGHPLEEGPVSASLIRHSLELDARAPQAVARAREAGVCQGKTVAEVALELSASANHGLRNEVPYEESGWRWWPELLAAFDPHVLKPSTRSQYKHDYAVVQGLLRKYRGWPPPHPYEVHARRSWEVGIVQDGIMGHVADALLEGLHSRGWLYHGTREDLAEAATVVQDALSSGTIEPLLLEFDSRSLVYPLYITSLSPGQTDIQLYILSDHRVQAGGYRTVYEHEFRTAFAGRLDEERLEYAPVLIGFLSQGREYLTELRGELNAREMTRDVTFARAETDDELRGTVMADGRVIVEVPAQHFLRSFAWFVGIGLAALALGIIIGRALRPGRRERRS